MSGAAERILIVEDDEAIRIGLEEKLTLEGFRVSIARDGEDALLRLAEEGWALVVLDLMLPKRDGLEVLRWLRERWPALPVLVLSARNEESDKIAGLRTGADDYLTKPFGLGELLARVDALLRRARGPEASLTFGDIEVDFRREVIARGGEPLDLSPKERALILHLVRHRDRAVSRDELHDAIWGYFAEEGTRAVDYHIVRLRRKIEDDPQHPTRIVTCHGIGYHWRG